MKIRFIALSLVASAALLTACGGGGGGDAPSGGTGSNGGSTPAPGGGTTTPPSNTAININGVFVGSGTVLGRTQDVVLAYQSGNVVVFSGDLAANTPAVYGRANVTNANGQTSLAVGPVNRLFLSNGSTSPVSTFAGSYALSGGTVNSVNAMISSGSGPTLNASSLTRSTAYVQTPLTRLPAGTYRARLSTTGETANLVVSASGTFSMATNNGCSINGTSGAPAVSGAPGTLINMDASGPCFPGSTSSVSLSGVGMVGTNSTRLLIGGNDTRAVNGLAISAEFVSGTTTPPTSGLPAKAIGVFEAENGRAVTIVDDSDTLYAMSALSGNPSLFVNIAVGRVSNGAAVMDQANFFGRTITGSVQAFANGEIYTSQINRGQFFAPKSDPTNLTVELSLPKAGSTTVGFGVNGQRPSVFGYTYNYDSPASLVAAAGRYSTREFSGGPVHNFTVSSSGALTGTLGTCAMSGQLSPRAKNLFDVTVTFGGAAQGCSNTRVAGQNVIGATYRGVSYLSSIGGRQFQNFALFDSGNSRGYGVSMEKCGPSSTFCQ